MKSDVKVQFQQISKITIGLVSLLLLSILQVFSQKLPAEYHFSKDGLRLIRGNSESTGFYNPHTIDTLYLTFSQPDYWTLLTNNFETKTDLVAKLVYRKTVYSDVGVRFKGETSYRIVVGKKKSFNISLDYLHEDQNIEGYTTINLNNAAEDRSRLREFLYEYFNRKHIPAVKANFAILNINGEDWGIYVNVQQLNKSHAREWFTDADATRWRAEPVARTLPGASGGNFGAGFSSLNYLNTLDTTLYQKYYILKNSYKKNPWDDLVKACYALNETPNETLIDSLGKYMDIDGALWFLAHEILFTDDDGYINKGGTDYYVYFDVATGRIVPIECDGNTSMSSTKANTWTPFERESNATFPLANVLFNHPELRQRYLAHVRTVLSEAFVQTYADSLIAVYSNLIDVHVKADPNSLYNYSEFSTEVLKMKSFINVRRNFLLSHPEVNAVGAAISSVVFKAGNANFSVPDHTQPVNVTASVSGSSGISKAYLYYGTQLAGKFTKLEMFDDGKHKDGGAGDEIYGAEIPAFPKETFVRYYIEAISSNTAATRTYSPKGAEHDVYFYQVKSADRVASDVVINELMPSNSKTVTDSNGEYDDWIELYNNSVSPVNLSDYYLTDSPNVLTKWKFPKGTTIAGKGYLIVWADSDINQNGLHASYKLDAGGEALLLVTPDQQIADELIFGAGPAESTFSRSPNGTGSFVWTSPTYNKVNTVINSIADWQNSENYLAIYPNPARGLVFVRAGSSDIQPIYIYNSLGAKVFQDEFSGELNLDVSSWKPGIYLIKTSHASKKLIVGGQ
ncbi:MAG: CotH kinase family protein [Prolixibacteraceae bacterium]|nr:CotH kinase family protein [Prolixibacteraceae bacterium]